MEDRDIKKMRGDRILNLRKGLALSQQQVADAAKISLSAFHELEKSTSGRNFREEIFYKIAKVLQTTPDYIMFGHKKEDEPTERSEKIETIQTKLIKMLLNIEDSIVLQKIEAYINDQRAYIMLKEQMESQGKTQDANAAFPNEGKKRRGRPPRLKIAEDTKTEEDTNAAPLNEGKKKLGRPPRSKVAEDTKTEEDRSTAPLNEGKKKRGRASRSDTKNMRAEENASAVPLDAGKKTRDKPRSNAKKIKVKEAGKKRGRPPRSKIAEDTKTEGELQS